MDFITTHSALTDILHALSQALLAPDIILLLLFAGYALFCIGSVLVEFFTERRNFKVSMPKFLAALMAADEQDVPRVISESGLLNRQKIALLTVFDYRTLPGDALIALIRRSVNMEETRYDRITGRNNMAAKISPMLGLMGTLIPLGPGVAALGTGDTDALSSSLLVAFDTTVAGLIVAAVCLAVGKIRNNWYNDYLSALDSGMATMLQKIEDMREAGDITVEEPSNYAFLFEEGLAKEKAEKKHAKDAAAAAEIAEDVAQGATEGREQESAATLAQGADASKTNFASAWSATAQKATQLDTAKTAPLAGSTSFDTSRYFGSAGNTTSSATAGSTSATGTNSTASSTTTGATSTTGANSTTSSTTTGLSSTTGTTSTISSTAIGAASATAAASTTAAAATIARDSAITSADASSSVARSSTSSAGASSSALGSSLSSWSQRAAATAAKGSASTQQAQTADKQAQTSSGTQTQLSSGTQTQASAATQTQTSSGTQTQTSQASYAQSQSIQAARSQTQVAQAQKTQTQTYATQALQTKDETQTTQTQTRSAYGSAYTTNNAAHENITSTSRMAARLTGAQEDKAGTSTASAAEKETSTPSSPDAE